MRRTDDVFFNVTGQTVAILVKDGRPTSATFKVQRNYALDDDVAECSGAATVDTVTTTTTAAAGQGEADPRRLDLTSTTGIQVGRRYRLSGLGLVEWVDVVEIGVGYVRVRHPLENDYAVSAALVSTYLTAPIDATFVASLDKLSDTADTAPDYRVIWSIAVNSTTVTAYSFFDLVRAPITYGVELADVTDRAPGLHDSMPLEYRAEQGRPLLDAAWRALRADLVKIGVDVNTLRDAEAVDELMVRLALRLLAEGGWHPTQASWAEYVALVTANYDRFFESHFAVAIKHQQQFQAAGLLQSTPPTDRAYWRK
jgi:hypothetical protein